MNAHAKIKAERFSGMVIFRSPDDLFNALLGPTQHDAHVLARRRHLHLAAQRAWLDEADARVRAWVASLNISSIRRVTHEQ